MALIILLLERTILPDFWTFIPVSFLAPMLVVL